MAKEESKLVEAVEESTEVTTENGIDEKFNPLAFTGSIIQRQRFQGFPFARDSGICTIPYFS